MTRHSKRTGLMVALMVALVASAAPAAAQESAPADEAPAEVAQQESSEEEEASSEDEDSEDSEASDDAQEDEDAESGDEVPEEGEEPPGPGPGPEPGPEPEPEPEPEPVVEQEPTDVTEDSEVSEDSVSEDDEGEEDEDPFAEADRLLGSDEEDEDDEDDPFDEPFEPTFGGRLELGWFFTDYERFNSYVLEPNGQETLENNGAMHIDLGVEAMVIRGLRISVVGGAAFNTQGDPSVGAWYVGLEPAYAVGDDTWEMAVGLSAMVGSMQLSVGEQEMNTSLTVLRPFFEVSRHFPSAFSAAYVRAGFNQWHVYNPTSDTLNLIGEDGDELDSFWLSDGGFYLAIGGRFGRLTQPSK